MLELLKTPQGIAIVNQAMTCGERSIAERIENQPAQGELFDGVRDVFRKADAEDRRFEDRVERVARTIESEPVPSRDVPGADTVTVSWGGGETLLTRLTFTTRLTTRLTGIARSALLLARVWRLVFFKNYEDVDFDELVETFGS